MCRPTQYTTIQIPCMFAVLSKATNPFQSQHFLRPDGINKAISTNVLSIDHFWRSGTTILIPHLAVCLGEVWQNWKVSGHGGAIERWYSMSTSRGVATKRSCQASDFNRPGQHSLPHTSFGNLTMMRSLRISLRPAHTKHRQRHQL
jgi:hypothetical protein